MLNSYVWDLYLRAGGNKTVSFFEESFREKIPASYAEGIYRLQGYYCVDRAFLESTKEQLDDLSACYQQEVDWAEINEFTDYIGVDISPEQAEADIDEVQNR